MPPDGVTPEEIAIAHVGALELYRRQKNDTDRLIIALKYELGWPVSDIAFGIGRSDTTVRTIINRVKTRIRVK